MFRFTIRELMMLVAVVALAIGWLNDRWQLQILKRIMVRDGYEMRSRVGYLQVWRKDGKPEQPN